MRSRTTAIAGTLLAAAGLALWVFLLLERPSAEHGSGRGSSAGASEQLDGATPSDPSRGEGERKPAPPAKLADLGTEEHAGVEEIPDVELHTLKGWSAPDAIEGIVLRGNRPIAGARIGLWSADAAPGIGGEEAGFPLLGEHSTDQRGEFAFTGLRSGSYVLRIRTPEGLTRETRVELRTGVSSRRVVMLFGHAEITGHVYDEHGSPVVGALVWTPRMGPTPGGGDTRVSTAFTDTTGRFSVPGLTEGRYWVCVRRDGRPESDAEQVQVDLHGNEVCTVDFGSADPPATWTGFIVDGSGLTIPGARGLVFTETESGVEKLAATKSSGAFELVLPAGEYRAQVRLSSDRVVLVGSIHLEPGVLVEQDLVLPGATLIVAVSSAPEARPFTAEVQLERERGGTGIASETLPDGTQAFFGLAPGTVYLTTTRWSRCFLEDADVVDTAPDSDRRWVTIRIPPGVPLVETSVSVAHK